MKALLKAELRKLLSVRSTYIFSGLALVIVAFFSFYADGYKGDIINGGTADLAMTVQNLVPVLAIFVTIIVMLLALHEYRYNTILYSITSANSRLQLLMAKVLASSAAVAGIGLVVGAVGMTAAFIGLHMNDAFIRVAPIEWWSLIWRTVFYLVAFALFGVLLGILTRNLTASLTIVLVAPGTVEPLLQLLLKKPLDYLPFHLLQDVLTAAGPVSAGKAALVYSLYLAVGWAIAALLFIRRDAN